MQKILVHFSKHTFIILACLSLSLSGIGAYQTAVLADDGDNWSNSSLVRTFVDEEGNLLGQIVIDGRPPLIKAQAATAPDRFIASDSNVIISVPANDWTYGCSATSAAMMCGYYDQPSQGYINMYTGPYNGGIYPMNNATAWGSGECPMTASHQGIDSRTTRGHVDDYWNAYLSSIDPYDGNWTEHSPLDCIADYMGTNQWHNWQNIDGATTFFYSPSGAPLHDYSGQEPSGMRDGCHGLRLFIESRGYVVTENYNQLIYGWGGNTQGFSFSDYKAQIDADQPVFIHVEGHTMLGLGYADPDTVYLHDTWDHILHSMTWGGDYMGNPNYTHFMVTVIELEPAEIAAPTVTNSTGESYVTATSARLNGEVTDTGGENPTVRIYWGETDGGTTPGSWDHVEDLGTKGAETFFTTKTGLTPETTYFYRCFASNSGDETWAGSTETFDTQASEEDPHKLVGVDEVPIDSGTGLNNAFILTKFTAEDTGPITEFKVNCAAAGNIKVAIYADNGGEPGALLNAVDTSQPVVAGWNTITFPSTDVVAGTDYWLAANSDVRTVGKLSGAAIKRTKRYMTFSSFTFPDPAGTGFNSSIVNAFMFANWSGGGGSPVIAPTVTNSTGESNVTDTSARLNGEVTDTGGENPTVHICWGLTDEGTASGDWDNDVPLGTQGAGTLFTDIGPLTPYTDYFYRCYAVNTGGEGWAGSTETFKTLASGGGSSEKLVGVNEVPIDSGTGLKNAFNLSKFTAETTGSVTEFKVNCAAAGNIKVAIYADNGGEPGALLNAIDTPQPVVAGWNTITFPSTDVIVGTDYWLAANSDVRTIGKLSGAAVKRTKRYMTFSSFTFPDPAGTGFNSSTSNTFMFAGWGGDGGSPVIAPTVTNASGESNLTDTSARLNGEVTDTGGENPTVRICWGLTDEGTTSGDWDYDVPLGTQGAGTFFTDIGSLTPVTTYHYRCYASNAGGEGWASSTRTFVTLASGGSSGKLVGVNEVPIDSGTGLKNAFNLSKFTAETTGSVTEFKVNCAAAGNIKVAIYADNGGEPGALLNAVDTPQPVVAGWNTVTFPSTGVVAGTDYWLGANSDVRTIGKLSGAAIKRTKRNMTFSSFTFPNPAGTGFNSSTVNAFMFAGWGE